MTRRGYPLTFREAADRVWEEYQRRRERFIEDAGVGAITSSIEKEGDTIAQTLTRTGRLIGIDWKAPPPTP